MSAYYNEIDPYAAAWLRNLISAGHIASGVVDERSIVNVQPGDLDGFTQCHFFAGIGGWSLALRLAMWPDARPVWTGSCPCQPFSAAGKRKGAADERHLWPEFHRLIAECAPPVVFGEQVASKDGRTWLAGVRTDLEALGYGVGAADLCAAGVGAPHIRQRLWWLADANRERHAGVDALLRPEEAGRFSRTIPEVAGRGVAGRMADADGGFACDGGLQRGGQHGQQPQDGRSGGVEHAASHGREQRRTEPGGRGAVGGCGIGGLGEPDGERRAGQSFGLLGASHQGYWSAFDVLPCTDGKARRVEPGSFPLAHGVPGRVGRLRAYGNAIVPHVAAQFIGSYLDVRGAA